ncbi:unnamed protein product [Prunus brigantina]
MLYIRVRFSFALYRCCRAYLRSVGLASVSLCSRAIAFPLLVVFPSSFRGDHVLSIWGSRLRLRALASSLWSLFTARALCPNIATSSAGWPLGLLRDGLVVRVAIRKFCEVLVVHTQSLQAVSF